MNTTPEWKTVPGMTRDESTRSTRIKAKRRGRIARKVAVAVVSIAVGLGIGIAVASNSDAVSQVTINKYIRANGGVPPCTHEDGSGQPGPCYWDASERGNGKGYDYVAVPVKGKDKAIVFLTGPKAKRY